MSFNKILAKKVVGTALKDGVNVTLSVATKTSHWERPEFVVDTVGDVLKKSVASWTERLPADTKEICSRESEHTSDSDPRSHLTVVCFNSQGEGTTRHVPVPKEQKS
ncbi:hypothetical protein TMatcc_005016 [Talaromyces marneffei ATCC 18224]|uniref:uncharacterized protein n=1 Tax=Talaromyces marneffei TaxID=37727 RepID=UPI0012A8F579|nr:uncharacterized protein EYB26_000074 [Talaromyces marneffei]KAE8557556.1 hypothetical protein EYB25_002263 [Talaromyces marneffei]QGA12430.1 hypothetical protein EYB26_000074 [Talaromyces marneffei]